MYCGAPPPNTSSSAGNTASEIPFIKNCNIPSSVTSPISLQGKSHFSNISITSFSFPFSTTSNILSWLSLRRSSQAFIPACPVGRSFCRVGTFSRSIRIPAFPLALISAVEHIIPAAPISCMPTTAPVCITSRQASSNFFSWKGSPTCTAGRSAALSSVISALANEAPPIPSLPVALPTKNTGFPFPSAVAETVSPFFKMPTLIAFTSGFVW